VQILEFEILLIDLGYKDKSKIEIDYPKFTNQMDFSCETGSMAFYSWLKPYYNKKSYLYVEFLEYYNETDVKQRIERLAKKIDFDTKTRIGDIGWDVKYTKSPELFTAQERTKMYIEFLSKGKEFLKGDFYGLNPEPGDMLAARPQGPKIDQGFTDRSLKLGAKQRALIAQRYGFGPLFEDGLQYARYNNELVLEPA